MNTALFILVVTFAVPTKNLGYETTKQVTANLTEQQCIAKRDAVLEKASNEGKNVIAICKRQ